MINKRNPEMEFIETDETGLVVFDPATGDTCVLDDIGASIFRAMGEGASLEEIVEKLSHEFNAPIEEIQNDVAEFLEQLTEQGIVLQCE